MSVSYNIGTGSLSWIQVAAAWKQSTGRVALWTGGVERTWNTWLAYERNTPTGFEVGGASHTGSDPRIRDLHVTDADWVDPGDAWSTIWNSYVTDDAYFYRFRGDDTRRLRDESTAAAHLTI
ncbi:MAG: hypothetical protein ACO1RT_20765 [Planctomycetaceae bacterium]